MMPAATRPDLSATLGPLKLKNPVMAASGTFGFGQEWADFFDLSRLGAIMVKAVTVEPRAGNPMPRMVETAAEQQTHIVRELAVSVQRSGTFGGV
jgi:dihydroorotate dehydrogenase (NAD+) catalytic subunit